MASILIYNLRPTVSVRDLIDLGRMYGPVINISLHRESAEIMFINEEDAFDALELNGQYLDGWPLLVTLGN